MNAISPPHPATAEAGADADLPAMAAAEQQHEGHEYSPSGDIVMQPGDQAAREASSASAEKDTPWPNRGERTRAASPIPSRLTNIEVTLTVELGRRQVPIRDLLSSAPGQLFTLEALTDDPVDVMVNGRLFARGEIVHQGDRYAVRLLSLAEQEG